MKIKVPDFFDNPEADRLYQMLLLRLNPEERPKLVIEACQQILTHAERRDSADTPFYAFSWQIDALVQLRKFAKALTVAEECELQSFGKRSSMPPTAMDSSNAYMLRNTHGPILYFLQRYNDARIIFDMYSSLCMTNCKNSLSLLPYIYSSIDEPEILPCVAHQHVYRKLGIELTQWSEWEAFVSRFSNSILKRAKILREDLLLRPELLAAIDAVQRSNAEKSAETSQPKIERAMETLQPRIDKMDRFLEETCDFLSDIPRI